MGPRADFGAFPVAVQPKPGPEARFPARKHYCATWCSFCTREQPRETPTPKPAENSAKTTGTEWPWADASGFGHPRALSSRAKATATDCGLGKAAESARGEGWDQEGGPKNGSEGFRNRVLIRFNFSFNKVSVRFNRVLISFNRVLIRVNGFELGFNTG